MTYEEIRVANSRLASIRAQLESIRITYLRAAAEIPDDEATDLYATAAAIRNAKELLEALA